MHFHILSKAAIVDVLLLKMCLHLILTMSEEDKSLGHDVAGLNFCLIVILI